MKKTVLKWLALVGLIGYLTGVSIWASGREQSRVCTGVEISLEDDSPGAERVKHGLTEALRRFGQKLQGMPLEQIDVRGLEQELRAMQYFEEVECLVTTGGKLRIEVTPMIPEYRVFTPGGESYYVNKAGKQVEARAEFYTDVPLVVGNFTKQFPASQMLSVVRAINGNKLLREMVTMIKADSPNDILLSTVWTGHVVNIGDTTRLTEKFRNLEAMYRQVLPQRGWNTYDTIYVKFKGQVVATRADKKKLIHSEAVDTTYDPEEDALAQTELGNQE